MSNLQTVQEIYEAFSRGDVPAILERCADAIVWEYGESSTDVPWLQRQEGKDGAAAVMAATAAGTDLQKFEIKALIEGDGVVVVLFDTEFIVKENGKNVVEEDAVHIWRFDNEGKVSRFRHRIDTHQQHLAYRG